MVVGKMRMKGSKKGNATTNYGNYEGKTKIDDQYFPQSVIDFTNGDRTKENDHPTQKPLDLIRHLIKTFSNENDLVFDGYMGSGTTAHACIKENRNFIGAELNKEYYDNFKNISDSVKSQGQNVGVYKLKGNKDNLHVKDYEGQGYRDTTYSDEMDKAIKNKKQGVLFKNTFDPGDPNNRVEQDIAAVFEPNQIRSKFAAFDPRFKNSGNVLAGTAAIPAADINPLEAFKGVQENILEPVMSKYNKLKSYVTDPLSKQLDLTKDKSASKDLKTALDMGLDPVNLIPGAPGIGAGLLQMLGEKDEEE
jgi:hypothetical protein